MQSSGHSRDVPEAVRPMLPPIRPKRFWFGVSCNMLWWSLHLPANEAGQSNLCCLLVPWKSKTELHFVSSHIVRMNEYLVGNIDATRLRDEVALLQNSASCAASSGRVSLDFD